MIPPKALKAQASTRRSLPFSAKSLGTRGQIFVPRGSVLSISFNKEPGNLTIRILVADDFAPWWRFISSTIVEHTDWHIVGEAVDGFEAVQKAGELKPDLILL